MELRPPACPGGAVRARASPLRLFLRRPAPPDVALHSAHACRPGGRRHVSAPGGSASLRGPAPRARAPLPATRCPLGARVAHTRARPPGPRQPGGIMSSPPEGKLETKAGHPPAGTDRFHFLSWRGRRGRARTRGCRGAGARRGGLPAEAFAPGHSGVRAPPGAPAGSTQTPGSGRTQGPWGVWPDSENTTESGGGGGCY